MTRTDLESVCPVDGLQHPGAFVHLIREEIKLAVQVGKVEIYTCIDTVVTNRNYRT
jgi:hypothetical protein